MGDGTILSIPVVQYGVICCAALTVYYLYYCEIPSIISCRIPDPYERPILLHFVG